MGNGQFIFNVNQMNYHDHNNCIIKYKIISILTAELFAGQKELIPDWPADYTWPATRGQ